MNGERILIGALPQPEREVTEALVSLCREKARLAWTTEEHESWAKAADRYLDELAGVA